MRDFAARRAGPQIRLGWTPPTGTSDGAPYRPARYGVLRYRVCVWPGVVTGAASLPPPAPAPGAGAPAPAQIPARQAPLPGANGRYPTPQDVLMPPCPQLISISGTSLARTRIATPAPLATLALAAVNGSGQWAGWSNPVTVPLAPVSAPPVLDGVQLTSRGVRLLWTPPQPPPESVLVFRQVGQAPAQQLARVSGSQSSFLDTTATWNQTYAYWLRSAVGSGLAMAESTDSAHRSVFYADLLPPPAPTGLEAVRAPGGGGVDLSWNAVAAPDLAGYNVYRRLPGAAAWQKRNATPLLTSVFHDTLSAALQNIEYAVTAVDAAGNQSPRSPVVIVH